MNETEARLAVHRVLSDVMRDTLLELAFTEDPPEDEMDEVNEAAEEMADFIMEVLDLEVVSVEESRVITSLDVSG